MASICRSNFTFYKANSRILMANTPFWYGRTFAKWWRISFFSWSIEFFYWQYDFFLTEYQLIMILQSSRCLLLHLYWYIWPTQSKTNTNFIISKNYPIREGNSIAQTEITENQTQTKILSQSLKTQTKKWKNCSW